MKTICTLAFAAIAACATLLACDSGSGGNSASDDAGQPIDDDDDVGTADDDTDDDVTDDTDVSDDDLTPDDDTTPDDDDDMDVDASTPPDPDDDDTTPDDDTPSGGSGGAPSGGNGGTLATGGMGGNVQVGGSGGVPVMTGGTGGIGGFGGIPATGGMGGDVQTGGSGGMPAGGTGGIGGFGGIPATGGMGGDVQTGGSGGMPAGGTGGVPVVECLTNLDCPPDASSCTVETCDNGICRHIANHALCANMPLPACATGAVCTTGGCQPVLNDALCADDGIACTVERCTLNGCQPTFDHAQCDDGVDCTSNVCTVGGCVFTPNDALCADDGVECTMERCDALSGCERDFEDSFCMDPNAPVCLETGCEPDPALGGWGLGTPTVTKVEVVFGGSSDVQGLSRIDDTPSLPLVFPQGAPPPVGGAGGSGGSGGAGGAGGAGGSGGAGGTPCTGVEVTDFPHACRTFCLPSRTDSVDPAQVDTSLVLVESPVHEPIDVVSSGECALDGDPIWAGRVSMKDGNGDIVDIAEFTMADVFGLWGYQNVLTGVFDPVTLDGEAVSRTGVSASAVACNGNVYIVTNGSNILLEIVLATGDRVEYTVDDERTLTTVWCDDAGEVYVGTPRGFTVTSVNNATDDQDMGLLVEARPARILQLDPIGESFSLVATVSGGSLVHTQNVLLNEGTADERVVYLSYKDGSAEDNDGELAYVDHLEGTVEHIERSTGTVTEVLRATQPILSAVRAPNGIYYILLGGGGSLSDCAGSAMPPTIGMYDPANGDGVPDENVYALDGVGYAEVTNDLCSSQFLEQQLGVSNSGRWGSGNNAGITIDATAQNPRFLVNNPVLQNVVAIDMAFGN